MDELPNAADHKAWRCYLILLGVPNMIVQVSEEVAEKVEDGERSFEVEDACEFVAHNAIDASGGALQLKAATGFGLPLFGFVGPVPLLVNRTHSVVFVSKLDDPDREQIRVLLKNLETIRTQLRAARSNLTLPKGLR